MQTYQTPHPYASQILPGPYIDLERHQSYLDSLRHKSIDLQIRLELEKLSQQKQLLGAQVYADLRKKLKRERKRQKYDLNDKNDLGMMEVIKKH